MITVVIGPPGEAPLIPVVVSGIAHSYYGCHGGTINSLMLDFSEAWASWGTDQRKHWAAKLPTDQFDRLKGWFDTQMAAFLREHDYSLIPSAVLNSIFQQLVSGLQYSSYTFNCVVNYRSDNRQGPAACATNLLVEYLLKNKIGTMVLGPTMFNRKYVGRSYASAPSIVRSAIWIPKPELVVFKEDTAVSNLVSIPTSSYPGRNWNEFLDASKNHYHDWNKLL